MILRSVLAVLAALVVNIILVWTGELALSLAFPVPHGVNLSDRAQLEAFMNAMPATAYLGLLACWALGAVAASAAAYFVAERQIWAAFAGAGINLAGVLLSVATIPHPLWVTAIGLFVPLMAAAGIPRLGGAKAA